MESRVQVVRRWKKIAVVIALVWVLGVTWRVATFAHGRYVHLRWYRHVELLILKLAPRCPADVTPAQWANCLSWTWNLHTNYGPSEYFGPRLQQPFAAEFERRLEGPVGLDTIDWIWDEFARCAPRSIGYNRYRPTTPQALSDVAEGRTGPDSPLEWWIGTLRTREREDGPR